jgi:hypothetical protein
MEKERDYSKDIAEIRTMMERSSKFLSLSGWAGIMAGIYALVGAWIAHAYLRFRPTEIGYNEAGISSSDLLNVCILAAVVLILALGTAIFLSWRRAAKRAEPLWNATSRRMVVNVSVPLVTGGVMILIFISKGLIGLLAPMTLIFYGMALYSAGNFTFREVRALGMIQILLGLAGCFFVEFSLLFWGAGFGLMHIAYGLYIHLKYQR